MGQSSTLGGKICCERGRVGNETGGRDDSRKSMFVWSGCGGREAGTVEEKTGSEQGVYGGEAGMTEPTGRVRTALSRRWGMIEGRLGRD